MKKVDFENGNITQNILMTALPMLIAQVLNLLYSIVDRIYIGRIPNAGTQALGRPLFSGHNYHYRVYEYVRPGRRPAFFHGFGKGR